MVLAGSWSNSLWIQVLWQPESYLSYLVFIITDHIQRFLSLLCCCSWSVSHFSHVWLFVTTWTPSMEFWLLCPRNSVPSPGDLPSPGIKLGSPAQQAGSLLFEPQGKPLLLLLPSAFCQDRNSCLLLSWPCGLVWCSPLMRCSLWPALLSFPFMFLTLMGFEFYLARLFSVVWRSQSAFLIIFYVSFSLSSATAVQWMKPFLLLSPAQCYKAFSSSMFNYRD